MMKRVPLRLRSVPIYSSRPGESCERERRVRRRRQQDEVQREGWETIQEDLV